MNTKIDFSFDRVARAYDAQRAHPAAVSAQVGAAIARVAGPGARVLELGVGTGRIALPVAATGCHVVGIDLSREMLREAVTRGQEPGAATGSQHAELPSLVQGDVQRLPFRSDSFDAVLAVHVLHLIPDWRAALAEIARVLRPGGAFIQGQDWRDPESCAGLLRSKLREAVMDLLPGARPPGAGAAFGQALARLGGQPEPEVIGAEWVTHASPAALLAGMVARDDAETWALDDDLLAAATARVREWAASTWGDLEADQPIRQRFVLRVMRGAWQE